MSKKQPRHILTLYPLPTNPHIVACYRVNFTFVFTFIPECTWRNWEMVREPINTTFVSYAEIRNPTSKMWKREWIWMHHPQQDATSQVDAKYFTLN